MMQESFQQPLQNPLQKTFEPVLWQGRYWLLAEWVFPVSSPPLRWAGVSWLANDVLARLDEPWQYAELPEALQAYLPPLAQVKGWVLTPGWVNAHTHLEQWAESPLKKVPEEDFADWLLRVVQQNRGLAQAAHSPEKQAEQQRLACLKSMAALQHSGVTCVADISSAGASLGVLNKAGWRAQVALELLAPFAPAQQNQAMQSRFYDLIQNYKQLSATYQHNSLLNLGLAPHSIYNVHPEAFLQAMQETLATWFHIHLGECAEERLWLQNPSQSGFFRLQQQLLGQASKPLPFAKLSKSENPLLAAWWHYYGLVSSKQGQTSHWLFAHGCQINPTEWQAFALSHTTNLTLGLAHCPQSNLALHGQTLQPWQNIKAFPLGLGTDGRLSTPHLDLRVEARLAQRLHQWNEEQVLEALTLGGAKALGLHHKIGSLSAGLQADLALWFSPHQEELSYQQVLASLWQQETAAVCLQRWVQGKAVAFI